MNIIEAIKSGKPFRRKGDSTYRTRHFLDQEDEFRKLHYLDGWRNLPCVVGINVEGILADDWEVETREEKKEFTFGEILAATKYALYVNGHVSLNVKELEKQLGFTETSK